MEPDRNIRTYSWEEMIELASRLGSLVAASSFSPTVIVAILRGGVFPALILSHRLRVRRMYALRVATTVDESARAVRHAPVVEGTAGLPDLSRDSVLIVDDVTNTGSTMAATVLAIGEARSPAGIRTAALLWDTVSPESAEPLTSCPVDVVVDSLHSWVGFPWETD